MFDTHRKMIRRTTSLILTEPLIKFIFYSTVFKRPWSDLTMIFGGNLDALEQVAELEPSGGEEPPGIKGNQGNLFCLSRQQDCPEDNIPWVVGRILDWRTGM